ncbi:hypothetical protein [Candidatus Nitrososphaera sp. FF02]|uniref:hypothetical protein n=1 Tax=Candidatus Nitrososphaera sp. FF02 TaxID=3398226 RepID=UPI0039EB7D9B
MPNENTLASTVTFKIPPSSKQEKSYRNFANTIRSPKTLYNYERFLKKFMKYQGAASFDALLQGDTLEIESRIIEWIHADKSITNTSKASYLGAIKHFYEMNRVTLSWRIIMKHLGEKERAFQDRAYSIDELLMMLNVANLREKVVLTLLASAGLRRQAVSDIKRKHLEKTRYGNYKITIYAGTKYEYLAYCSRECAKWIDEYFLFRESKGEKFNPESPLLREEFDITDHLRAARPRMLTEHAVVNMFKSLTSRAGLRATTHLVEGQEKQRASMRKEVMLTHGFRKFCNTTMVKAKVYPIVKERLLGHTTGLEKSYLRPSDEDMLAEYMKAEPLLTIEPTARQAVRIQELESERESLIASLEKRLRNVEKSLLNRTEFDYDIQGTEYLETDRTGRLTRNGRAQLVKAVEEHKQKLLKKAEQDPSAFLQTAPFEEG